MSEHFRYGATFSDNILVVGQAGCEKASFLQSLGKSNIFADGLLIIDWVSKIDLTKAREDEIKKCVEFKLNFIILTTPTNLT